jgi:hypothetical protein
VFNFLILNNSDVLKFSSAKEFSFTILGKNKKKAQTNGLFLKNKIFTAQ